MIILQNKIIITLLVLLGTSGVCFAQSNSSLSGKVIDDKGNTLSGAYIDMFLSSETSEPIATVISDSLGEFHLSTEKKIKLIRAQYIGYDKVLLKAPFADSLIIKMESMPLELKEVAITGKIPTKITPNGIKFTPTQMQRQLPNISHYISQLPFVEKSGDSFVVVGKGRAVFYINNRRIEDLKELKELKMNELQSVEVIPNPGIMYDSDIKAVIKIKTKKKQTGMGFELTSGIIHSERTELWNQGNFSYNTPTLCLQTSLVYDYDPTFAHLEIEQLMRKEHTSSVYYNSTEKQIFRNLQFRNSLIYTPNKNNSFGVSMSYGHSNWTTNVDNGLHYTDDINNVEYGQKSHSTSPNHKWVGNLFYNYSNKKIEFFFNTDIYRGIGSRNMTSISSNHTVEPDVDTRSEDSNFLCYFQALGSYNISEFIKFQIGADYAHTSVLQAYNVNSAHAVLKPFDIKTYQHRYAEYASLNYAITNFAFSLGLRHETLSINREDDVKKGRNKLFSISKLYPSASVTMTKGAFQSQLSYSLKTEYPTYNQLCAGLSYSSPYLYESGNPDLCPETRHELSFLGKFLNSSLMLNYTAIRDEIIQVPTLYSDNIMLYRPENTGINKYLSLSVGQQINWGDIIESSLKVSYHSQWLNVAGFTKKRGDGYIFSANNAININKNIQCFINGSYQSASENGLFKIPQAWNVDLALNLSFLSDRLNIYLECTDIFSTLHAKRGCYGNNISMDYSRNYQTRTFTIQVSYSLPNIINGKRYKGNTTNSEIQRL